MNMKKLIKPTTKFLVLFSLLFFFATMVHAAGSVSEPASVAEKFLASCYKGNFEDAKSYVTEASKAKLDAIAAKTNVVELRKTTYTFTLVSEEVVKDEALLHFQAKNAAGELTRDIHLAMIKEKGAWKAVIPQ